MARRVLVPRRGKNDQKGAEQPGRPDGLDAERLGGRRVASRALRSQSGAPSDKEQAEQPRENRVTSKATDHKREPIGQNGTGQPTGHLVARKAPDSHEGAA